MADVASALRSWSATAASNSPSDSTTIGTGLDDNLREIQAVIRKYTASPGSNMASGATVDLSTADGYYIAITGTTTITSFGTESAGISYLLRFVGALTLTHNGTTLILPGAANITTVAGDMALMISEGSGNWRCANYLRSSEFQSPATATPLADAVTGVVGTSTKYAREDHVHPFTAQTWQSVTRTAGGSYTNSSGQAIELHVEAKPGTSFAYLYITVDGVQLNGPAGASGVYTSTKAKIPAGSTYSWNVSTGTLSSTATYEMR